MTKEVPKEIYRGVVIRYSLLDQFEFGGQDLLPPNPPSYDQYGRKTVGDGNEYGVYMSDNKSVAKDIYGGAEIRNGEPINHRIRYMTYGDIVVLPSVGILYTINTDGLDVHIPWISQALSGHYNNGIQGDEWVAERIPMDHYRIESVTIGQDTLHEAESISVEDYSLIKPTVMEIIEKRKERLEMLERELEKMTSQQRRNLFIDDIEIYKLLFKVGGLLDIDLTNNTITNGNELLLSMMSFVHKRNSEEINMRYLRQIYSFIPRMGTISIDDVTTKIEMEISNTVSKREAFIEKKKAEGEEYDTRWFDSKIEMFKDMLKIKDLLLQVSVLEENKEKAK